MILFVWLNSFFWGLTPLMGWSRIWYEPTKVSCTVDIMNPDYKYKSYIVFCTIWCYIFPILAMIYCKVKMLNRYEMMPKDVYFNYKQMIVLIILFLIEWTPYAMVYVWPFFDDPKNIPMRLALAGPVFAKLSVVLNPLLYLIQMSTFQVDNNRLRKV